jgi:hypothetical protein
MATLEKVGRRDGIAALALAAILVAAYLANGEVLPGNDATANVYLAAEVVETGRFSFSPSRTPWMFPWRLETRDGPVRLRIFDLSLPVGGAPAAEWRAKGALVPETPYYLMPSSRIDSVTGDRLYVGTFGVGAAMTAVPLLAALRPFAGDLRRSPDWLWMGAKVAAALLAATAAALVFLTLREWLSVGPALFLAVACGLGTPLWSTSSQSLWQHAPATFFLAGGTLALVRARGRGWSWALSGLAFAAAAACRPPSVIFGLAVGAWLLVRDRQALVAFAAGAAPVLAAVAGFGLYFSGSPFHYAQMGHGEVALAKTGSPALWQGRPWVTLPRLLLSPSRGLLVFCPFLVLALPGGVRAWRRPGWEALRPISLAVLAILAVDSFWFDWWGGWSYGPRRLADLAPALTVLAAPAIPCAWETRGRRTTLAMLVAWSMALQVLGVMGYDVDGWNGRRVWTVRLPSGNEVEALERSDVASLQTQGARVVAERVLTVDHPEHRARLWSIRDGQITYYATHLTESRRRKSEAHFQWIESWRPRAR